MGKLHDEHGGNQTALRALGRGSRHGSDSGHPPSPSQGFITEGDLSGGGGQPAAPAPTEFGARAAVETLVEQLRQAERSLAAQHEGVIRLVGQLLGESVPAHAVSAPAGGNVAPASGGHLPASGSFAHANGNLAQARGNSLPTNGNFAQASGTFAVANGGFLSSNANPAPANGGAFFGPAQQDRAGHSASTGGEIPVLPALQLMPERPSSQGRLGGQQVPFPESDAPRSRMARCSDYSLLSSARSSRYRSRSAGTRPPSRRAGWAVPYPESEAPRMHLPGELDEDEMEEFLESEGGHEDCPEMAKEEKQELHFELHECFTKITKKHKELHRTKHMMSAVIAKRASAVSMMNEEGMSQVHTTDGFARRFMLNPNSAVRAFWDIMSMLLVLYDMVMVPFGFFEPEITTAMRVMNWTTRCFWTGDIPMSFVSGYVTSDGSIEMRPRRIARKYMRSWFILDVVVVGSDWTEIIMGEAMAGMDMARMSKITRIFRILRMIRLLRLAKVGEIVNLLAERLPSEKLVVFIDILKLIVIMLGIGHLLACVWYVIGKDLGPSDRIGWNWLDKFDFLEEALEYRYIMSMRWALSQFAGGMDEVTPVSLAEHIYAGFVYIFAFWSGTVFLSILTSHFTQLYILGNQQSQQLNVMRRYLSQNGISKGLVLRVTRNAQHTMKMRQKATPEAAVGLLELVSEPLRIELHHEMYFPMLGMHPFFADYMKACPFVVRKICHAAMSTSTYSKDDVIFHFGEAASRMLIVRTGTLVYRWGSSLEENITEGRWLSEPPLWTHWAHRGVLTASEDSVAFAVDAALFQSIVGMFEIAVFDPCEHAARFVRALNNVPSDDLSDLPIKTLDVEAKYRWGSGTAFGLHRLSRRSRISRQAMDDIDELVEEDLYSDHSGEEEEAPERPGSVEEARDTPAAKRGKAAARAQSERRARTTKMGPAAHVQPRTRGTRMSRDPPAQADRLQPGTVASNSRTSASTVRTHMADGQQGGSQQLVRHGSSRDFPQPLERQTSGGSDGGRLLAEGAMQYQGPAARPQQPSVVRYEEPRPQQPPVARYEERPPTRSGSQERMQQLPGHEKELSRRLQLEQLEDLCKEEEV